MSKDIDSTTLQTTDLILAFCVIAIIIVTAFWTCKLCCKPDIKYVKIEVVSSDSLRKENYLSKEQADSLIAVVKNHERELAEKYQYVLEQKMTQDQYYSLGTFVVGVVLSLFGFFGFKSMQSIEQKANKDAERAAKQTSEDVTRRYLEEHLKGMVSITADNIFNSTGAKIMKEKVQEETIKHDEEYIESQMQGIREEWEIFKSQNQQSCSEQTDDNSDKDVRTTPSSEEDDDVSCMFK